MIAELKRRYQHLGDRVRAAINDCAQTEAPGAGSAGDLTWAALLGSIVVLLALAAISALWAVIWWRRTPSRPLASINSWGAWMLAGLLTWASVKVGAMAIRKIKSRRHNGAPR
jgi:hypothetical protein